ncbi:MAG: acyltransferase domain-containing protein, partial [Planctomycetaceae bacterium]|nr:acyltransferase domain-containing protein [Planctomycetaceae bacterium]
RAIRPRPLDIAVVGLACLVPGATTAGRLWHNILTKHSPITEIPPDRFEADRWFDGDRKARDKIYGKWGGFVADLPFDPLKYGIPPASIPSIEPMQLLAMELVDRALRDAGYGDHNPLRERTSIVLGVGGGAGELGANYAFRAMLPRFLENPDESLWGQLPEWTEDSFAGILFNVVAGRISNRFDFGGVNCTIDAACASSLAAVYWACHELASGQCDMAISGGCDTMQNPFGYLCFAKAGALSPRGVPRVFDADADGIVISEGHAAVVLKRREDAERDGDKIYALIRAVSSGSDGRSKGLTAPRMEGQLRTLRRAYAQAGVDPASVRLFEAHGTGTAVGDQTEGQALTTLLAEANAPPQSVAVGSIKSMIGHTKCAAGAVGLVKAIMALQHRVLPPTLHVERPNPKAGLVDGPLFANTEARPWLEHAGPRRAGVSSFGFGGTNFHVLLEEYDRSPTARPVAARADRARELFVVGADEPAGIPPALRALAREAECLSRTEIDSAFARFAYTQHLRTARVAKTIRAALIAASLSELQDLLQKFAAALNERGEIIGKLPAGVHYTAQPPLAGETAFLFPGQGSQHPGMLQELAVEYPEVRACLERADAQLETILGDRLSKYLHPAPAYSDADRMRGVEELKATHIAQPALGACGRAMHLLLEAFGLRASMYAGHSFGELVALAAAGAVSEATLLQLAAARGQAMAQAGDSPRGAMLAVSATAAQLEPLIHDVADVWLANRNSPSQTVLSGSTAAIAAAQAKLEAAGVAVRQLPVSVAFHTPYMNAPREAFRATLAAAEVSTPTGRVYSNVTAAAYDGDATQIRTLLAEQLTSEVRFVEQIERMYQEGARIFVEVGPKGVLTGLVREILRGRPHVAIATQSTVDGGAERFLSALALLAVNGVDVSLDRLYEHRELEPLNRATLAGAVPEPLKPHMWLINGAYARRVGQPRRDTSPQARLASSHEPFTAVQQQTGGPTAYREESVENEPSMPAPPGREAAPPRQIATANHIASEIGSAGHPPEPVAPAGGGMTSNDYALFQQTMRQFLQTQESVLRHLFGGGSGAAAQGAIEAAPAVPVAAPPATRQTPPVGESPASSADGVEPAVSPAVARQPVSAARPASASPPMPVSPAPKAAAPSISEPS